MNGDSSHAQGFRRLEQLIKGIKVAMLTTAAHDGTLRSRPMLTVGTPLENELWFFTAASSPKVDEI